MKYLLHLLSFLKGVGRGAAVLFLLVALGFAFLGWFGVFGQVCLWAICCGSLAWCAEVRLERRTRRHAERRYFRRLA